MSRYFFDVDDGDRTTSDAEGAEFANDTAARRAGVAAMVDLSRKLFLSSELARVMSIRVLGLDRRAVSEVRVSFSVTPHPVEMGLTARM